MRWPSVMALSAVVLLVSGCENVRNKIPFLGKKQAAAPAGQPAEPIPAPGVTTAADTSRPAPPPPAETPGAVAELIDEPWTPVDTGTVDPGMTRDQVIALWGIPVAERMLEGRTFLYFRNGCEVSCGTFDVVFLENNQVVDAVVRGMGHNYSGVSSSPPERQGVMTPPSRPAVPPDTVGGAP